MPISKAIAIYLIGGVVKLNFAPSYHRGFGQLDELPTGLDTFGFIHISRFLSEVVNVYTNAIFPKGESFFANRGEFGSLDGSAISKDDEPNVLPDVPNQ